MPRMTLDYQLIVNPAYNRDRGPVSVFGARLHAQYSLQQEPHGRKLLLITADYQLITNPAYNADRGPASIFSGRLHGEF